MKNIHEQYVENVTAEAKEVISEELFTLVTDRAYQGLLDWSDSEEIDERAVAKNIVEWANNKYQFVKAIMEHPDYDPEHPCKIIRKECDFTRQKDNSTIYSFEEFAWYYFRSKVNVDYEVAQLLRDAFNFFREPFITAESAEEFNKQVEYHTRSVDTELGRKLMEKVANECKPHDGQKTSKFIRKLLTSMGMDWNEFHMETTESGRESKVFDNEREFAKYADAINPITFKRTMIFSVEPLDYLLASHGNSWCSCYWINREEPGSYEGRWSRGTWSYMNDNCTIITYVPTDTTTESLEYAEKIFRQMVMYDGDAVMMNSRLYPQSNDNGSSNLYKELRLYDQTLISEIFHKPNMWEATKADGVCCLDLPNITIDSSKEFMGYNDPRQFKIVVSVLKTEKKAIEEGSREPVKMYYGGKGYCPTCGDKLSREEGRYVCSSCDNDGTYETCANCGCSINTDDDSYIYWENTGEYFCCDCYSYCDYHGEYEPDCCADFEEINYANGNYYGRVCNDAIREGLDNGDMFECEHCGQVYYGSPNYSDPNGNDLCDECFDDTCIICDNCGEVVWIDDAHRDEETGEYFCEDCWKEIEADRKAEAEETTEES